MRGEGHSSGIPEGAQLVSPKACPLTPVKVCLRKSNQSPPTPRRDRIKIQTIETSRQPWSCRRSIHVCQSNTTCVAAASDSFTTIAVCACVSCASDSGHPRFVCQPSTTCVAAACDLVTALTVCTHVRCTHVSQKNAPKQEPT